MQTQRIVKVLTLSFLALAFFSGSTVVHAVLLEVGSDAENISLGTEFMVDVVMSAEGQELNAVEGIVIFPDTLLALKEVRDGNSAISFWVERPRWTKGPRLSFSGVVPGGYKGERGLLFSLVFIGKSEGVGTITLEGARTLRNDGEGSPLPTSVSSYTFSTIPASSSTSATLRIKDTERPEVFVPVVTQNPNLHEGKHVIIFATQDKGSGIARYEVREGRFGEFVIVESPYVLKNQKLNQRVFVKAVDRAGNERTAVVHPTRTFQWKLIALLVTVVLGILIGTAYIVRERLWQKLLN